MSGVKGLVVVRGKGAGSCQGKGGWLLVGLKGVVVVRVKGTGICQGKGGW